ncbi:hypothetical protein [Sphingomonas rubra]|uniref:DUF429 domain-containing protein n=1 Tax=Sphingomonas rubra TaxID=634430 RepID=A0A1I5RT21_9SPHN|nr:hypothetical protein [Sphingomonas rubra]SFP61643.1 hypothetical protein SAMN04488241_104104 [Sphingomonas rubra]
MRFTRFACFDWSGAAAERPAGIALAVAGSEGPPRLVERRWSRPDALAWLRDVAGAGEPMLIGIDFSPALPFVDAGCYFPGWSRTPPDAVGLWALVEAMSADDPHLGIASFLCDAQVARYFRQHGSRLGDRFGERGGGRLRIVERRTPGAASCFNLVGASQVGKASLTGMRLLHALRGTLPIWPFDPLPPRGPVLVEIYTTIAARAAGIAPGRSKVRDTDALRLGLARLGSPDHPPLARYDDHATDAILTAAWLRTVAHDAALWAPAALTPAIAATEGWTFGVP